MEELENLEETLNESIRESIGARAGVSRGKKKQTTEDDEDLLRYLMLIFLLWKSDVIWVNKMKKLASRMGEIETCISSHLVILHVCMFFILLKFFS